MFTALIILSTIAVGFAVYELLEDDDDPVAATSDEAEVEDDVDMDMDIIDSDASDDTDSSDDTGDDDTDPDTTDDSSDDSDASDDTDTTDDSADDTDDEDLVDDGTIIGDDGTDTFGTSADDVMISRNATPIFGLEGNDLMTVEGDGGLADGGPGNDTITADGEVELIGGDGADILEGLNGATLSGGDGGDALRVGNGEARGLAGNDAIVGFNSRLNGDAGDDFLVGSQGSDVSGGAGNDFISVDTGSEGRGGSGDDTVIGRAQTAVQAGETAQRVVLEGNRGSDIIQGNTGVDIKDGQDASTLQAVIGQDDFYGVTNAADGSSPAGLGAAVMTGFAGADQFEIVLDDLTDRSGSIWSDASLDIVQVFEDDPIVVINDFAVGEDMLLIESETPDDVEVTDDGEGGSLIVLDFGQALNNQGVAEDVVVTLQLKGVAATSFTASMIAFGAATTV